MQIYKTRWFTKWAGKEGFTDSDLSVAIKEIAKGLIDADLGGHVLKKRVGHEGQGKRGGLRTLIAFKVDDKAFLYSASLKISKTISIRKN